MKMRRGVLTSADRKFIQDHLYILKPEGMADQLQVTYLSVVRYRNKLIGSGSYVMVNKPRRSVKKAKQHIITMKKATVTICRHNAQQNKYEPINTQQIEQDECDRLQLFLEEGVNIEGFFRYDIVNSNGINYSRYSTYADALGYVRARQLYAHKPSPVANQKTQS